METQILHEKENIRLFYFI